MSRDQFIAQLRQSLGNMSEAEKQDIIYDYDEHFRNGLAEGKTEEQIAQALGNPRIIGKSYRIDALLEEPREGGGVTAASVLRAIILSLSLTFVNVVFVLGPFIALLGVLFALWCAVAAIVFSGFACMVAPTWSSDVQGLSTFAGRIVLFFSGIGVSAMGELAGIGMWLLTKWFFLGVAAYVKFNARIVRGEH